MTAQAFQRGDLVKHGARDDGKPHRAIVLGSYADLYGGHQRDTYTIKCESCGWAAWHGETSLHLIERGRLDLLADWEAAEAYCMALITDLDWIFSHGDEVLSEPRGASLQALADSAGLGSLWGARGEGIDYHYNSRAVLEAARSFLLAADKEGWLRLCETIKVTP